MSKKYVSKAFRENIVKLLLANVIIDDLKENEAQSKELFGSQAWGWLKQANTLIFKSLHDGLALNIEQEDVLKIHVTATQMKLIVQRKTEPTPVDFTNIKTDHLYNLAEHAINTRCRGCTIEKFKECTLYEGLHGASIPKSCTEKGKCPYLL